MSKRKDCKWCGFSYADIKQGRGYLYHDEAMCEREKMLAVVEAARQFDRTVEVYDPTNAVFQGDWDDLKSALAALAPVQTRRATDA